MSKHHNDTRIDFYLSFFEDNGYEEKEVNGYWLVKQLDGANDRWTVHLYSKESYDNYKKAHARFRELEEQEQHLFDISKE